MLKLLNKFLIILIFITSGLTFSQQWAAKYKRPNKNDAVAENKSFSISTSKSNFVYVTGFSTGDTTGTITAQSNMTRTVLPCG